MAIALAMGPAEPLGFRAKVIPITNGYSIYINSEVTKEYNGLLMFVSALNDNSTHHGYFVTDNPTKFKFFDADYCLSNFGVKGQRSSTIAHNNIQFVSEQVFQWYHGNKKGNKAAHNLQLQVVVASGMKWQRLDPVPLK